MQALKSNKLDNPWDMQSQNLKEHEITGQKILALYVPSDIQFPLCTLNVQYFSFPLHGTSTPTMQIQYAKRRKSLSNADSIG
jgi:hypothetical protein